MCPTNEDSLLLTQWSSHLWVFFETDSQFQLRTVLIIREVIFLSSFLPVISFLPVYCHHLRLISSISPCQPRPAHSPLTTPLSPCTCFSLLWLVQVVFQVLCSFLRLCQTIRCSRRSVCFSRVPAPVFFFFFFFLERHQFIRSCFACFLHSYWNICESLFMSLPTTASIKSWLCSAYLCWT